MILVASRSPQHHHPSICFLISYAFLLFQLIRLIYLFFLSMALFVIFVLKLTPAFVCFSSPGLIRVIVASVVLFTFSAWVAVVQLQLVKAELFCERKEPLCMFFFVFFLTQGWRFSCRREKPNTPFNFEAKPATFPSSTPSPQFVQLKSTSMLWSLLRVLVYI